ncbi:MAG: hypothetical protein QOJ16_115 [Acidobacteriota bacterium]|jgi:hypothetical protein|nr:hypothetical protein [Acidobacteriota bacterium]
MEEHRAEVDPELLRQLDVASEDQAVGAVFSLRPAPGEPVPAPEATRERVERLLDHGRRETGGLQRYTVFPNLGSFAVQATRPFLQRLLEHEEIATATANEQPQDMLIRPVSEKKIKSPGGG